jgi:tape measure domain-containing protein
MADSAEFVVSLVDKVSPSAKRAAASMRDLAKTAKLTDKYDRMLERSGAKRARHKMALQRLMTRVNQQEEYRAAKATTEASQKRSKAWMTAGGIIAGAASLIGAAVSAGAMAGAVALAHTAQEANQLVYALDRLTHGHGAETMRDVSRMAADLGLNVQDTVHQYSKLLKLQFSGDEAKTWIKYGADMQALGNSAEEVQGIMLAIGQIRSKGRLQGQEMLQLAERGVSGDLIKNEIARIMKIQRSQVDKYQEAGKINWAVAQEAIQQALNKKLNMTAAGQAAEDYVKSFAGGMNRGTAQLERIWLGFGTKFADSFQNATKAMAGRGQQTSGGFMNSLGNDSIIDKLIGLAGKLGETFANILPPIMEAGKALMEGLFEGSGMEGSIMNAETFGRLIGGFIPMIKSVGRVFGFLGAVVTGVFAVIGSAVLTTTWVVDKLVSGVMAVPGAILGVGKTIFDFFGNLVSKFTTLGGQVIEGFVQGIKNKWEAVKGSLSFASDFLAGAKKTLDIHSPSKEMAWLGEMSVAGYEKGLESRDPMLPSSSSMVPGGGRAAGSGGVVLNLGGMTIHVNGGGDAEEIGEAVFAQFEAHAARLFGQYAGAV